MTKIFLIMVFCLQNTEISLEDTCIKEITKHQFDTIEECKQEVTRIRMSISHLPDLYSTGFCTTKTIQTT